MQAGINASTLSNRSLKKLQDLYSQKGFSEGEKEWNVMKVLAKESCGCVWY